MIHLGQAIVVIVHYLLSHLGHQGVLQVTVHYQANQADHPSQATVPSHQGVVYRPTVRYHHGVVTQATAWRVVRYLYPRNLVTQAYQASHRIHRVLKVPNLRKVVKVPIAHGHRNHLYHQKVVIHQYQVPVNHLKVHIVRNRLYRHRVSLVVNQV